MGSPDPRSATKPGSKSGARFTALSLLGRGGMGRVYRVWDHRRGCEVALKLLHPQRARQSEERQRFVREFELLSQVVHRNLVQVLEFGEVNGTQFYTMEAVSGAALGELLGSGPLAPAHAVELLAQLADGLSAVHEAGILHRDIKPDNVLVDRYGTPKLVDFGLAVFEDVLAGEPLTEVGCLVGTPRYLPPEVVAGGAYERTCDVFQLALVLYEALTGRPALDGVTRVNAFSGRAYGRIVPLSEAVPGLDEALGAVVGRALARDPRRRTPSAAALRDELCDWLEGRAQRRPWRRSYATRRGCVEPPALPSPSPAAVPAARAA